LSTSRSPGTQQALDVGEREVALRVARDVQQPARRAFGQRVLRDQVRRQVEVEVVEGEIVKLRAWLDRPFGGPRVRDAARRTCTRTDWSGAPP
jgi:hypothetical protein